MLFYKLHIAPPSPVYEPYYIQYGYFGAGTVPAAVSRVNRIDYANVTATAATKGPLAVA